ncbi:MAG: cobyrinate a,c-diamide synthase [Methylococcales bacterium]
MPSAFCPAYLITAPASGQGKTSVTAAIARYHSQQGLRVRCFKTGPDFIDPGILAKASGQAVYNLDTWIMGSAHCRQLLYEAAAESDLILVEGVMGLFDGKPSSADLAELFGLPILPVIDASAMAQTFAALLYGLANFRRSLAVIGAVANFVASAYHAELLQTGVPEGLPLACLLRNPELGLPERHLGLQIAEEITDIEQRLNHLADAIKDTCLAELPKAVEFLAPNNPAKLPLLLQGKTIAVARDAAFCFLYEQNLRCLTDMGAKLLFFSPLADAKLPLADAIYLPGGYPELYAQALAANTVLRTHIQAHIAANKPLLAECGGMLYLAESLCDSKGRAFSMLGVLPGAAIMHSKLSGIGSEQVELDGQIIRGHTFHYSTLQTALPSLTRAKTADGRDGEAVYRLGPVLASYLHFYFPANPEAIAKLFLS